MKYFAFILGISVLFLSVSPTLGMLKEMHHESVACCEKSCCSSNDCNMPVDNERETHNCNSLYNPFFGTCCCHHGFIASQAIILLAITIEASGYISESTASPVDIPIPVWQPPKIRA